LQQKEDTKMSYYAEAVRLPEWSPIASWFRVGAKRVLHATRVVICSWPIAILSVWSYLAIISTVAVYDMHLTIRYSLSLKQYEQNPIGRWLMNLDQLGMNAIPDLTLFLSLKALGTISVLIVIVGLVRWRARVGHPVGFGVATFQIALAYYLTYVEPNVG